MVDIDGEARERDRAWCFEAADTRFGRLDVWNDTLSLSHC